MTKRGPRRVLPPPPAPLVGPRPLSYRVWSAVLRSWTRWRLAWIAVLVGSIAAGEAWGSPWREAAAAWVLSGSAVLTAGRLVQADADRRALEHEASGLPEIAGGWRMAAEARDIDPHELLLVALAVHLHEEVRLISRPIKGHRHGAKRVTYEVPIRALARRWAQTAAGGRMTVRAADALVRELEARGVIQRVTVNQATAYRLVYAAAEDAIRHLERTGGTPLVAWAFGRNPRATGWSPEPAGAPGATVRQTRAAPQPRSNGSP